jgi:hypothetical protein
MKANRGVTKYTKVTTCSKEPREVCAPAGCGMKEVGKQTGGGHKVHACDRLLQGAQGGLCPCRLRHQGGRKANRGVSKYTPVTACSKKPMEVCAPACCGIKEVGKPTGGHKVHAGDRLLQGAQGGLRPCRLRHQGGRKGNMGVTKYTPVTACSKESREFCSLAGCGIKEVGKQTGGSQSTRQ